jgi:hypothetical protein
MLKAMLETYRTAGMFARACPLLFLVPALPELAQHIVEYRLGMFASIASAKAVEHDDLRMIFGSIKTLTILLSGYWVVRFGWWGDGTLAGTWHTAGVRGYVPVFLYGAAVNLGILWTSQLVGGRTGSLIMLAALPLQLIPNTLLSQWMARAPLGDGSTDPRISLRIVAPDFPWAFIFGLVARLPAMAAHYALNFLSIGKPPLTLLVALGLDAIVVSYLTAVICLIPVTITRHAKARTKRT